MDLLLILTYAAVAYAVFKIFKIPVTAYSLLTAALGGIALIGALLLGMGYNHPFTKEGRFYFSSTPILPDVSGRVIAVEAEAHQPLKAGDVLFRIDPVPYEKAVAAARARLEQEKSDANQRAEAAETARQNFAAASAPAGRRQGRLRARPATAGSRQHFRSPAGSGQGRFPGRTIHSAIRRSRGPAGPPRCRRHFDPGPTGSGIGAGAVRPRQHRGARPDRRHGGAKFLSAPACSPSPCRCGRS